MNSQERHEARYQRRKARREQRAREAGGASFEEVMSFGNICKAGKSCCDGARWKTSTINFETNLLGEAQATYDTLHYGKRVFQSYQSWRAHAKRCNSYDTLRAMDERFTRMFAEELAGRRKPFPCTMKATRTGCGWIYRRHGAVIEEEMCA